MGLEWVSDRVEFVYNESMRNKTRRRQLRDAYRFEGFIPGTAVIGVFGNPSARVLTLGRRRKKLPVERVVTGTRTITTKGCAAFGIFPVATPTSIWS